MLVEGICSLAVFNSLLIYFIHRRELGTLHSTAGLLLPKKKTYREFLTLFLILTLRIWVHTHLHTHTHEYTQVFTIKPPTVAKVMDLIRDCKFTLTLEYKHERI